MVIGFSQCSPAATSSPQAAFSSLFLPPPHSPSFDFGPASPTLNASQINQYATYASSNGYPDDVPFVLSAGLGAALGLEDSPVMDSPGYPEDDLESDDGQSQYVVIKDRVEDDDDNEPLSTVRSVTHPHLDFADRAARSRLSPPLPQHPSFSASLRAACPTISLPASLNSASRRRTSRSSVADDCASPSPAGRCLRF